MSFKPFQNTAISLAREASKIILQNIDRLDRLKIQEKAHDDYVSNIDQQVDRLLCEKITELYPEHNILSEESNTHINKDGSDYLWVIDPIDGTYNFISGIPIFAISIALLYKNEPVVGVIYQPMSDELFTASQGEGAKLNNVRIRATPNPKLNNAIITSTKGNGALSGIPEKYLAKFNVPVRQRAIGTAALSIAYQACGRFCLYYGRNLKLWDIAAGIIIAKEAGAVVQYQQQQPHTITEIVSGDTSILKLTL